MYSIITWRAFEIIVPFFGLLLSSGGAQSAFVDSGLNTTDTSTGLVWLDLTQTENFSYDQVETELLADGLFEEYRRATELELGTLFTNFGLVSGPVNAVHSQFINLFGETTAQGDNAESFGYADGGDNLLVPVYGPDFLFSNGVPSYNVLMGELIHNRTINFDGFGSFLVKPVPVPAAIWFFGSGLISLIGFARINKRK